jgi:hypothetical protein
MGKSRLVNSFQSRHGICNGLFAGHMGGHVFRSTLRQGVTMRHLSILSLSLLCVLGSPLTQAADWSSDTVSYRYVSAQSEPGVVHEVAKNVLSFTHVSGDKLGSNFFTVDLLKSSAEDPANGSAQGAQEWYGFYKRTYSLKALTHSASDYGIFKDIGLTARLDAGSKNTTFAPSPFKVRVGANVSLPVSAGFWDVGLEAYKERNNNGIVGKSVSFDVVPALTSAWAIPVSGVGTFTGFMDIVGPKGKDGFDSETKTETLLRAMMMFDLGGPKSGLQAGFGLEYWNNKFGCNNASSNVKDSCKATTPVLQLNYKL